MHIRDKKRGASVLNYDQKKEIYDTLLKKYKIGERYNLSDIGNYLKKDLGLEPEFYGGDKWGRLLRSEMEGFCEYEEEVPEGKLPVFYMTLLPQSEHKSEKYQEKNKKYENQLSHSYGKMKDFVFIKTESVARILSTETAEDFFADCSDTKERIDRVYRLLQIN